MVFTELLLIVLVYKFYMKSLIVKQIEDFKLEPDYLDIPKITKDTAILKVDACGLCGSDVEQFKGSFGYVSYPLIPGHEPIGTIIEIGSEAKNRWNVNIGDLVALEPHISCGSCFSCISGNYHLCKVEAKKITWTGNQGLPAYGYMPMSYDHGLWGGYSQYMYLHPNTVLHKIPKNIPLEIASMYQALAAGVRWAVQVPKTSIGDTVLILGSGQRGLASVIACKEVGAKNIIVTGLKKDKHKLNLAKFFGANHTINIEEEDTIEKVMEYTDGQGVDVILDVVPIATQPIVEAIEVAKIGATIVLGGVKGKKSSLSIDTDKILFKELTVRGVYSQGYEAYQESLRMLEENKYDFSKLKTHEFSLINAEKAIKTLYDKVDEEAICIHLNPNI